MGKEEEFIVKIWGGVLIAIGGRVWWSSGDAAALAAPDSTDSMLSYEERILAGELLDHHFADHGRWHLAISISHPHEYCAHGNVAQGV